MFFEDPYINIQDPSFYFVNSALTNLAKIINAGFV